MVSYGCFFEKNSMNEMFEMIQSYIFKDIPLKESTMETEDVPELMALDIIEKSIYTKFVVDMSKYDGSVNDVECVFGVYFDKDMSEIIHISLDIAPEVSKFGYFSILDENIVVKSEIMRNVRDRLSRMCQIAIGCSSIEELKIKFTLMGV